MTIGLRLTALTLVSLFLLALPARAQDGVALPAVAAKRAQALALSARGRHPEALPLLEELTQTLPADPLIWERYGIALYSTSATLTDPAAAQQMRVRAKQALTKSHELGNNNDLVKMMDAIPADGSIPPLSRNTEAQAFLQQGEAAFGKGDFPEAIASYQKALNVEPTNYNATLFIGDCYFRQREFDHAGDWFARAIALAPNIETAHRYWGDALLQARKPDEAKAHFIDAFLAEPYSQGARTGLSQWSQATGARFVRPNITPPATVQKTDTGAQITFNPSVVAPGANPSMAAAWLVYSTARVQWQNGEFQKRFPNENVYRHSLPEEVFAFERLLAFADDQEAKGQPLNDPQIATIRGLRDKGMLESFVLLHAPDAGIAKDYPQYRAEHRDQLQTYVEQMIIMPQQ
jgi:tetratricopeptide (TPR) repeat protein